MLVNRREKLALIHLAKKDCALDDDSYRALLVSTAGVSSSSMVETEQQFKEIMKAFKRLGFVSKSKKWPYCSAFQLQYIKALWAAVAREKTDTALRSFIRRIAHVDDPAFMDKRGATKVILALRKMCWSAGINPDEIRDRLRQHTPEAL
jgi:hypothetical protein